MRPWRFLGSVRMRARPCSSLQTTIEPGQGRRRRQGEAGLAVGEVGRTKPQARRVAPEQWEHPAEMEPFGIVCPEVREQQSKRWPGRLREFIGMAQLSQSTSEAKLHLAFAQALLSGLNLIKLFHV